MLYLGSFSKLPFITYILGEMPGRGRPALLHLDGLHRQPLALGQTIRQEGVLHRLDTGPPAQLQHRFSLGGEAVPAALHRHSGFGVPMGGADCPNQPQRHQPSHTWADSTAPGTLTPQIMAAAEARAGTVFSISSVRYRLSVRG